MQFDRFIYSVMNKELIFVSPNSWKDPFERRFYKTDYNSIGFTRPEIACMCLSSKSSTNEEASWRMYVESNDKALRLSIEFEALCKVLEEYATVNNYKIYIGKVEYLASKKIELLHKDVSAIEYSTFFPTRFLIEHYLTLMLLKRVSFEFENEVRIFIVNDGILPFNNGLLRIKDVTYSKELVPNIIIAPYEPLSDFDIRTQYRRKMQKFESDEYKKIISALFGSNVLQSQLYSKREPLLTL